MVPRSDSEIDGHRLLLVPSGVPWDPLGTWS